MRGERAVGHAEELGYLPSRKRRRPGAEEELARFAVEHDVGQRRTRQPAFLPQGRELLVIGVRDEPRCRVVEHREVKFGHKVHNTYDGTPKLTVVKWLQLAFPRGFSGHCPHAAGTRSKFGWEGGN